MRTVGWDMTYVHKDRLHCTHKITDTVKPVFKGQCDQGTLSQNGVLSSLF